MASTTSKLMTENVKLKQSIRSIMEHYQSFKKKHQKIAKKEPIAVTENKDNLILQQNKMLKKQLKQ